MKICHVKIKTPQGMFDKPVSIRDDEVKIIEHFLDDLYDTDHLVISIQGFRIEDWGKENDELGEDPSDDSEGIDSFP